MNVKPLRSIIVILIVFFSAVTIWQDKLLSFFESNPQLNGFIVLAMLVGMIFITWNAARLGTMIRILRQADEKPDDYKKIISKSEVFETFMSRKDVDTVRGWNEENLFSAEQVDDILSSMRLRIGEIRNFSNYFSGVLIILGLLGTFLGLLETIKAISEVFSGPSLKFLVGTKDSGSAGGAEVLTFFEAIAKPLAGMGIAFSSSLFGLSGSLFVGLLAFVSSRSQAFFLFDVFDWFKSRTVEKDKESLDKKSMTNMKGGSGGAGGLMGSLISRGIQHSQTSQSGGETGNVTGTGQFKGDFDGRSLTEVFDRLELLSKDAIEKNGLLAQAALKLGENLALEQKRLADIATYQQRSSTFLASINEQSAQQIHIMNQLVEASHSNTDREEFRALASHFHRSFDKLLSEVSTSNRHLLENIKIRGDAPIGNIDPYGNQNPTAQNNPIEPNPSSYTTAVDAQHFESSGQEDRR